jgi:hypothetical protein
MDPDEQYQREEEWLKEREAPWTGMGFGCVLLGLGLGIFFVILLIVLFLTHPPGFKGG